MSWLSNALGKDKKREQQQLREWQGAGSGARIREGTIAEGERMGGREDAYQESRNRYVDLLQNGQDAFNTSARAAVDAAMPSFNSALEGVRANAIRRGVSNGELGTSYEGDLASAFQKNITNSIGSQALGLYGQRLGAASDLYRGDYGAEEDSTNRYFDLLTGVEDRKEIARQRKLREQQGWAGLGIDLIGKFAPGGKTKGGVG